MQPPEGPPVCTALNRLPFGIPPPMVKMMSRRLMPMGTSTRPVLLILPTSEKIFVPLLFSVPMRGEPVRAAVDDQGHVRPGLHVVEVGRPVAQAPVGRVHVLGAGPADPALDRRHERGGLPAHEGARAAHHLDREVVAAAEDVLAQEAVLLGLAQRDADVLDGQRVLGAHVDVPVVAADGPGADDHALEHRVRVRLEHGPVHVRARVALVGVADDVAHAVRRVRLRRALPLASRGEARAAAAAQAGLLHLLDHLVGRHRGEHLRERRVAAGGDVVLDVGRHDPLVGPEHEAHLLLVERHLLDLGDGLLRGRVPVQKALDHLARPGSSAR